jgi:hypothetical protein
MTDFSLTEALAREAVVGLEHYFDFARTQPGITELEVVGPFRDGPAFHFKAHAKLADGSRVTISERVQVKDGKIHLQAVYLDPEDKIKETLIPSGPFDSRQILTDAQNEWNKRLLPRGQAAIERAQSRYPRAPKA